MIGASFGVLAVEVSNDLRGGRKNLWSFDGALCNGGFAVCAAVVECEMDLIIVVAPIERIFHFIAVIIVTLVGNGGFHFDVKVVLAETFFDE